MYVIIILSKPKNVQQPRVNPKVNCGLWVINYDLWVIMLCQCRFILDEKCTIKVSNADNGGGRVWGALVGGDMGILCTFLSILL